MRAPLKYKHSLVLSPAVEAIERAIQSQFCGVYVHWGPFASGKTVALKDMTVIMQSKGHIVKYLDAKDKRALGNNDPTFINWLRSHLGLSLREYTADFESFLPKSKAGPTVIIIDHFEDFLWTPDAKPVIEGLCRDAFEKKTYKIVLCINGCKKALEVLNWNGGENIRIAASAGCGRWDIGCIKAMAALAPRLSRITDEQRAEIIRLGAVSGSPSVLREMVHTGPNEARAVEIQKQYAEGIEKINEFLRSIGLTPA
jgi:hypothetical protein